MQFHKTDKSKAMDIVSMVQMKYERVLINTFYLLVAWHIKAKRNEHNV